MTTRAEIRRLLAQGRYALSVGRVREVVPLIKEQPALAAYLVELLFEQDIGISQRAADVLERVSHKPSAALYRVLAQSKETLVGLLAEAEPKKLRWNLALTLGRLPLSVPECHRCAQILSTALMLRYGFGLEKAEKEPSPSPRLTSRFEALSPLESLIV